MLKIKPVTRSVALACALTMALTALGSGTLGVAPAYAQYGAYSNSQAYFNQRQIDNLVAPIALYPDPLLAQVLAAAAYPDEINAAHRFVARYGNTGAIDRQPWDYSVRSVAHYPTALNWLASDLPRTQALGIAYINQPDAVANSIQRWRAQAYGLGNLYSNSQQVVYVDGDYMRIVPAQPRVIYVPVYEPRVIYVEQYRPNYNFLAFGLGLAIGTWLDKDWDWRNRRVYYYDRSRYERGYPVFYPQFDRVYVDRNREWRPEQSRFRPPAQVIYPTSLDDRAVAPPPPDRRPRDRERLAAPTGSAPGGTPSQPPAGVVPPPGKLAPDGSVKPGDVDKNGRPVPPGQRDKPAPGAKVTPTDNAKPGAPGKPADGDKGRDSGQQDQKAKPGQAVPGTTVAPPDKTKPVDPAKPGDADRVRGASPADRNGKPTQVGPVAPTPPATAVQPAPVPAVPPGAVAPAKKDEPKDEPKDGKVDPNLPVKQ